MVTGLAKTKPGMALPSGPTALSEKVELPKAKLLAGGGVLAGSTVPPAPRLPGGSAPPSRLTPPAAGPSAPAGSATAPTVFLSCVRCSAELLALEADVEGSKPKVEACVSEAAMRARSETSTPFEHSTGEVRPTPLCERTHTK